MVKGALWGSSDHIRGLKNATGAGTFAWVRSKLLSCSSHCLSSRAYRDTAPVSLPGPVVLAGLGHQLNLAIRAAAMNTPSTDKAVFEAMAGAKGGPLGLCQGKLEHAQRVQGGWGRLLIGGKAGDGEEENGFLVEAIFCPFPRASLTREPPCQRLGRRERGAHS